MGTLGTGGVVFGDVGGRGGGGIAQGVVQEVGSTGRNLMDAMSSKFVANIPSGVPQSDLFQNATVKMVRADYCATV